MQKQDPGNDLDEMLWLNPAACSLNQFFPRFQQHILDDFDVTRFKKPPFFYAGKFCFKSSCLGPAGWGLWKWFCNELLFHRYSNDFWCTWLKNDHMYRFCFPTIFYWTTFAGECFETKKCHTPQSQLILMMLMNTCFHCLIHPCPCNIHLIICHHC